MGPLLLCLMLLVSVLPVLSPAAFAGDMTTGNTGTDNWHKHSGAAMGTLITLEFWHQDQHQAKILISGVMAEMQRIDQLMSPYITTSELARVNRRAYRESVQVSTELFNLIELALQYGKRSNGAFDITYASIGSQYDYRNAKKPSPDAIRKALPFIDYSSVLLNKNTQTVRLEKQGTKIDLGGIAKGYAVDCAVKYLYENGVRHAMVSAGGDSHILGDRRGRPWIMGIKAPRGEGHLIALPLQNVSVSTSGDYERYFIDQSGERHHHIINPENGRSASHIRSVTVIGPNSTMTDALSTSVFVMGVEQGLAYINGINDVSVIIIDEQGKLHYSNDLVRPERK